MKKSALFLLFAVTFGTSFAIAQRIMIRVGALPPVHAQANLYAGGIVFIDSGTCPTDTMEVSGFDGKTLFGTLVAHGDVGGTGGADSITATTASVTQPTIAWPMGVPTSTTPTIAWPAGVPTQAAHSHTYTDVVNHTHTINITDPGHTHVQSVNSATSGGLNGYGVDTSTNSTSTSGYSTASSTTGVTAASVNPGGGVASGTTATATPVISWPAGVPTNTSPTLSWPAGVPTATLSAVTMNSFDNRSAYIKWIACKIN